MAASLQDHTLRTTLKLAFQTIGIVYGDMGTSPLYVYSSAFNELQIGGEADVLGALSIIIYTITLIPLIKYVFIVLRANNNGEGPAPCFIFFDICWISPARKLFWRTKYASKCTETSGNSHNF